MDASLTEGYLELRILDLLKFKVRGSSVSTLAKRLGTSQPKTQSDPFLVSLPQLRQKYNFFYVLMHKECVQNVHSYQDHILWSSIITMFPLALLPGARAIAVTFCWRSPHNRRSLQTAEVIVLRIRIWPLNLYLILFPQIPSGVSYLLDADVAVVAGLMPAPSITSGCSSTDLYAFLLVRWPVSCCVLPPCMP